MATERTTRAELAGASAYLQQPPSTRSASEADILKAFGPEGLARYRAAQNRMTSRPSSISTRNTQGSDSSVKPKASATQSAPTKITPRNLSDFDLSVEEGRQFTIDWFKNRPMMQNGNVDYSKIPKARLVGHINGKFGETHGVYDGDKNEIQISEGGIKKMFPKRAMQNQVASSNMTHEATHAIQQNTETKAGLPYPGTSLVDKTKDRLAAIPGFFSDAYYMGDLSWAAKNIGTGIDDRERARVREWNKQNSLVNPIRASYQIINKTPKLNGNEYLIRAEEVHARIMQWRRETNTAPSETITPELYYQRKEQLKKSGKQTYGVDQLYDTISDKDLINLLNKTAQASPRRAYGGDNLSRYS